ncbi:hypothetical protein AM493_19650 [Flavobacterium akiainvivens]|uniref:Uncharacterized protein n=1 Tax=Flavobacterium akiainvivens TaxID=1202724 RepID=A0A0M8MLJ3_9FLAO|nr:hypothetical protein [Flavobacterium akiainvivens]KOS08018.1 hypothetical protein AM493_19650 [Flavobacterium akiainvivens]SFQ62005.1 hypothetical protein SAMN05444144_11075 [Flavobacterium akiainvivens]
MRYLIYILFLSGKAFAQQDSVQVTVRNIEVRPNATFLQTIQNSMPNHNIVSGEYLNTYMLSQADKDSIYAAAFSSQVVQDAINNKFSGRSKLIEKGYELELISLLKNDSISNTDKKNLLIERILSDYDYNKENNIKYHVPFCGDYPKNKKSAITFFRCRTITDYSYCGYIIDGVTYIAVSLEHMQRLINKLRLIEMATIDVQPIDEVKIITTQPRAMIFITTKPN